MNLRPLSMITVVAFVALVAAAEQTTAAAHHCHRDQMDCFTATTGVRIGHSRD